MFTYYRDTFFIIDFLVFKILNDNSNYKILNDESQIEIDISKTRMKRTKNRRIILQSQRVNVAELYREYQSLKEAT